LKDFKRLLKNSQSFDVPQNEFEFRGLLELLARYDARFLVIGGVALGLHGSDYTTKDLDIAYARDTGNLKTLVAALAAQHPHLRGAPEDVPFIWDDRTLRNGLNFTLRTDRGDIDLLGEPAGMDSFDQVWARATVFDLGGFQVRVASIDDLIAMKVAAGRPKDLTHVMELKALKKVLEEEAEGQA
jgi:hypothetical protein